MLKDVEDIGVGVVEVSKVIGGLLVVGTTKGDPVADAKVDNAVVDGLAVVEGIVLDVTGTVRLDPVVEVDATVAVIVPSVSGTEPIMPAQRLYTTPSELVEEQFETTQRRAASPRANPEGFGVTQRNSRDDVLAQLELYSVWIKLSRQVRAQAGTLSTTCDGRQELALSFRACIGCLDVHDD